MNLKIVWLAVFIAVAVSVGFAGVTWADSVRKDLVSGLHVSVPTDWEDLGSAIPMGAALLQVEKMKELDLGDNTPLRPLFNLRAKGKLPPATITLLLKECSPGECPTAENLEYLINNRDELKRMEDSENTTNNKLNEMGGHKTIKNYPLIIKRECGLYSMSGGMEASMYKKIDFTSKSKIFYLDDGRLLGLAIGYPSKNKEDGSIAESTLKSFGCR